MTATVAIIAADVRAPSAASGTGAPQRISGTGTTAVGCASALTTGEMATLQIGAAAVRVGWGATKALAETAASATAMLLPAYGRERWHVSSLDTFVALRDATNGAVAFEGHVFVSSGPRGGE